MKKNDIEKRDNNDTSKADELIKRDGKLFIVKVLLLISGVIGLYFATKGKGIDRYSLSKTDFAMGTVVNVTVYNLYDSEEIAGKITRKIKEVDNDISWRLDGDISKFNSESKKDAKLSVNPDTFDALAQTYKLCQDSEGALDMTIQPLVKLWNIEEADAESFVVPSEDDIKACLDKVNYQNLELGEDNSINVKENDVSLNLGAVGKGYALDVVKDYLDASKVRGANVSVGGSILVYGSKTNRDNWRVGVRNPKGKQDEYIGYISVPANSIKFISTSGDYEKNIEKDGKVYHHILNPKTGYPAESEYASVTVICDSGLVSDGLSTACYILGYDKSVKLLEKYNASAVFVDRDNNVKIVGEVNYIEKSGK